VNDFVPNGAPNKALRGAGSGNVASNYNAFYWFVGDDWKVTSRLTLNAGLRYEYTGVPRAENLQAINAISDDPALGIFFRAPKPDINNFAPRLGFAYDPTGHGKWAVRGGVGVAYDVTPNNFAINSLPPQLQTEQKPAITCALPGHPAWCATWNPAQTDSGQGFLAGGGLLTVNVPATTQAAARAKIGKPHSRPCGSESNYMVLERAASDPQRLQHRGPIPGNPQPRIACTNAAKLRFGL